MKVAEFSWTTWRRPKPKPDSRPELNPSFDGSGPIAQTAFSRANGGTTGILNVSSSSQ